MKKEKQTKSFVLSLVWWRGRQMTGIPINLTFFFHFSIFDYYYYYYDDDDDDFFSSLKFFPFHLSYLHRFFFFFLSVISLSLVARFGFVISLLHCP